MIVKIPILDVASQISIDTQLSNLEQSARDQARYRTRTYYATSISPIERFDCHKYREVDHFQLFQLSIHPFWQQFAHAELLGVLHGNHLHSQFGFDREVDSVTNGDIFGQSSGSASASLLHNINSLKVRKCKKVDPALGDVRKFNRLDVLGRNYALRQLRYAIAAERLIVTVRVVDDFDLVDTLTEDGCSFRIVCLLTLRKSICCLMTYRGSQ